MTHNDDQFDEDDIDVSAIVTDEQLAHMRAQLQPVAFDTGFADRVMHRLADAALVATRSWSFGLQTMFWRVAPLAAAAVLVIASMNARSTASSTQPFMDRVLGLPTVTIAAAYTLDGTFGMVGR